MSDTAWAAFFACLPATIAAIGALLAALRNGRKTDDVHATINGRMNELLAVTATTARAEGAALATPPATDPA